uniref:PCNA-associated factor n=1 Tax=Arvicanthis niloticus TaxID=61156 RepID=UPI00148684CF
AAWQRDALILSALEAEAGLLYVQSQPGIPAENKYAGGNPVCVRPTPKWQKGIGEFFRLSPKDSKKENQIPVEAGSSGLGKTKRKACPLQPDHRDDENE